MLDDTDVLSAIKVWMSADDIVLSTLSRCFINRQLFRGKLLTAPLTDEEKAMLREHYANLLHISEKETEYFFVEHISTSNTYSEKDDSIDILYQDGSVRDIAAASEILDLKALTRKPQKLYVFQLDRLRAERPLR